MPALLRSGRPVRGIFNGLPCAGIVEMCAYAGFDCIVIDNEHGAADLETTEHMLRVARASGITPIVRCFEPDIARVLDMGASGVQIPMVDSVDAIFVGPNHLLQGAGVPLLRKTGFAQRTSAVRRCRARDVAAGVHAAPCCTLTA